MQASKTFKLIFSSSLFIPITLVVSYVSVLFYFRGSIPTIAEIMSHFAQLYQSYGYEIIFVGALLEALILVNFFIPGATAVALGAIFARSGHIDLSLVITCAVLGGMFGYTLDFILGYFGFGEIIKKLGYGKFLDKARNQIQHASARTFGLGFIHPNIASFLSLAAGTSKIKLLDFLVPSFLATIAWVSIWGLLIYALGEIFLTILTRYTAILAITIVSIWVLFTFYERRK